MAFRPEIGEKVLVLFGPLIYDAKVLDRRFEVRKGDDVEEGEEDEFFLVHYLKWSKKWDEWVHSARVLEFSQENIAKQMHLKAAYEGAAMDFPILNQGDGTSAMEAAENSFSSDSEGDDYGQGWSTDEEGTETSECSRSMHKCEICLEPARECSLLDCCSHTFCFSCINEWSSVTNICPICRRKFRFITRQPAMPAVLPAVGSVDPISFPHPHAMHLSDRHEEGPAMADGGRYPTHYIDEEAVQCLEGDRCQMRHGLADESEYNAALSVGCDACQQWFHAICVGFDITDETQSSWFCPHCQPGTGSRILSPVREASVQPAHSPTSGQLAVHHWMDVDPPRTVHEDSLAQAVDSQLAEIDSTFEISSGQLAVAGSTAAVVSGGQLAEMDSDSVITSGQVANLGPDALTVSDCQLAEVDTVPVMGLESQLAEVDTVPVTGSESQLAGMYVDGQLADSPPGMMLAGQLADIYVPSLVMSASHLALKDPDNAMVSEGQLAERSGQLAEGSGEDVPGWQAATAGDGELDVMPVRRNERQLEEADDGPGEETEISNDDVEGRCRKRQKGMDGAADSRYINEYPNGGDGREVPLGRPRGSPPAVTPIQAQTTSSHPPAVQAVSPLPAGSVTEPQNPKVSVRCRAVLRRPAPGAGAGESHRQLSAPGILSEMGIAESAESQVFDEKFLEGYRAAGGRLRARMGLRGGRTLRAGSRRPPAGVLASLRGSRQSLAKKLYAGGQGFKAYDHDWHLQFWRPPAGKPREKKAKKEAKVDDVADGREAVASERESQLANEDPTPGGDVDATVGSVWSLFPTTAPEKLAPEAGKAEEGSEKVPEVDEKTELVRRAREILGRKAVPGVQSGRQGEAQGKGKEKGKGPKTEFQFLTKIPDKMLPFIAVNLHSRVPTPMRQIWLNKWIEFHLSVAKPAVVGDNEECQLAIKKAVESEAEVFRASASKVTYVGQSNRSMARTRSDFEAAAMTAVREAKEAVVLAAMKAAGLVSDGSDDEAPEGIIEEASGAPMVGGVEGTVEMDGPIGQREETSGKCEKVENVGPVEGASKLEDKIKSTVEIFVRSHLDPLLASGVISNDQFLFSVLKTTAKILQHHSGETSTKFLIRDGSKVKRLAEQYLQVFTKRNEN